MKKIECVIFDWAGTTVDYGCFAPVAAFIKAFEDLGITITVAEARGPMGMTKINHIQELFKLDNVSAKFQELYSREWNMDDVVAVNRDFEKYLFASLPAYTEVIPGVLETVATLKEMGLRIGSTSGYTEKMMEIVSKGATANGYTPECYVTSDGLPYGRPRPFMIYQNMINLAIDSPTSVIKVGDTVSDILEGVNAGVCSVGIILGSSELAMSEEEVKNCSPEELHTHMERVREVYKSAGADYIIDSISDLPSLIQTINK